MTRDENELPAADDDRGRTDSSSRTARADSRANDHRSGPLIASVKVACRAAFLTANVRVVEAYHRCELQCAQKHLGSLYGLLEATRTCGG